MLRYVQKFSFHNEKKPLKVVKFLRNFFGIPRTSLSSPSLYAWICKTNRKITRIHPIILNCFHGDRAVKLTFSNSFVPKPSFPLSLPLDARKLHDVNFPKNEAWEMHYGKLKKILMISGGKIPDAAYPISMTSQLFILKWVTCICALNDFFFRENASERRNLSNETPTCL